MKRSQKGFSAIEIILVIVAIGLLGALGWVYFSKTQESKNNDADSSKQTTDKPKDVCSGGSASAENGTFCAKDVGISLPVPDVFKGKLEKIDNYTVYKQDNTMEQPKIFGTSEAVYEGTLKGQNDQYSLTISKEPIRTFRVKSLRGATFDKDTGKVIYGDGVEADSITVGGIKFYNYGSGDAGVFTSIYVGVVKDSLVVVSLDTRQILGDPATQRYILDTDAYSKLFNQFKDRIKSLKVV